MNEEVVSIRKLEGPYKYHLYIGFAPANEKIVLNLRAKLEEHGLICCLRSTNDHLNESIQTGVATSQKCLIFITPEYLKDDWYQMETSAVVEKSKRFCRDAVIILTNLSRNEIPIRLREFSKLQYKPEMWNDEAFLEFASVIASEPNVELAVLPKQNVGYASACGYFYGYLRLVLPGFKKRLIEETLKNDPDIVPNTVKKMLIIMPESCDCAAKLDSPNQIEFDKTKFVLYAGHRAGNHLRDYKSSFYKLTDDKEKQKYYFVGELATPLMTMYETHSYGLFGVTKDQLYTERDAFYVTLKAILSHPDNATCKDQFKLLYWSDLATDEPNIYDFLLPVLREEIKLQRQNESNLPDNTGLLLPSRSFVPVPVRGCNPARIYDDISSYPMCTSPRGMCLIVNIVNFDQDKNKRKGAEGDGELLKTLFKRLHFEVRVCNDVNERDLDSEFLNMRNKDHTNYDAFVCCIMSHGNLGVIYTSDEQPVEILSLVKFFTDEYCPTLKGKPKMFFIQACQKGDPEPDSDAAEISLSRGSSTGEPLLRPSSSEINASHTAASVVTHVEEAAKRDPTVLVLGKTRHHKAVLIPGSPDFLMSYSTLPGSLSYRDAPYNGAYYIQALCACLGKGKEIDRELKKVISIVEEKVRQHGEKHRIPEIFQLPFHMTSGMGRLIYL